MLHIIRTDSDNPDFRELVRLLDQDLAIRDGEEHAFYSQFNQLDKIRYAVVAYLESQPVGCGALRAYSEDAVEVKRMFVLPELRGRGIAGQVLTELETWAAELDFTHCILETGKKQPEAIQLYQKAGYELIPNYGQYLEVENSVCMQKKIK
ncbi:MAG: GNAT family N-acetyltransferase [Saprospiraceae bacterium]|jgi:putative acetyltransferase|nr:GNAT family N-acetyltransferase [Saprospiraceae bacterium]